MPVPAFNKTICFQFSACLSKFIKYQLLKVSCWTCLFKKKINEKEGIKNKEIVLMVNLTCSQTLATEYGCLAETSFALLYPQRPSAW